MRRKNVLLVIIIFISSTYVYSDLLSDLNEQFLSTYNRARTHVMSITDPLIICNGDDAVIIHRGKRFEEQVIPKLYHDLKSISHIPFKIYLTVMFNLGDLSENHFIELEQYLHDIQSLRNSIQLTLDIQQNQYDIIDLSIKYLEEILKSKFIDEIELNNFCQQARMLFSINIELAARAQLDMLDSKIRPWYQDRFNDTERQSVKVIIMGPKTARYGYLEKAYFYALFGERHEGKHIIYAESVDNEQKALDVLGSWILDARASASFFHGDSERLHRDLLSVAANQHIKRLFNESKTEL